MSYRIDSVAAYFRNEGQEGLCLKRQFFPHEAEEARRFATACEEAMVGFDLFPPARAIAWLDDWGRRREQIPLTQELGRLGIMTIHWLERRGHIVSDEYNGVLWIGVDDVAKVIHAVRHDPPSGERLAELHAQFKDLEVDMHDTAVGFDAALRRVLGILPGAA